MTSKRPILLAIASYFCFLLQAPTLYSQTGDCPYPILFLHGFTGDQTTFSGTYQTADFQNIWGGLTDVFHGVLNAQSSTNIWGPDGIKNTGDDDVLTWFTNENNVLSPGCIYALNWDHFWNEDEANPILEADGIGTPLFGSDSNESAIVKQGYAIGKAVAAILAANPTKDKVILVGHSMGGLGPREYLQRKSGGIPLWWVNPNSTDGHQIAKLVTTSTPHLGSNFFGNPWPSTPQGPGNTELEQASVRDGFPDILSEATRDLRYNYAFNPIDPFNCGFFASCPGPYLFGGDEDQPWGYYNEDINCDGDADDIVDGINIAGSSDAWDGTYDNPVIPLPTNLRYTWITSDIILDSGDGVVAWDRQWLYSNNTPRPSNGTPHQLTDTILGNSDHLSIDDNITQVIRSLDEGDYPQYAWQIDINNLYGGIPQRRSDAAPENPINSDPDWFSFNIPADFTGELCLSFTPTSALSGRVDFFSTISNTYLPMSSLGNHSLSFGVNAGPMLLNIPAGSYTPGATNYMRIIHQNVGFNDWQEAYDFEVKAIVVLPVEWLSFKGEKVDKVIQLNWSTASESGNDYFAIEKSGRDGFETIGTVKSKGYSTLNQSYTFNDEQPNLGDNYYRIRQVDFDEHFSYSEVINVPFETTQIVLQTIAPNPFNQLLSINLYCKNKGDVEVNFYSLLGQLEKSEQFEVREGFNTLRFYTDALEKGMHVIEIQQEQYLIRKKILKQ